MRRFYKIIFLLFLLTISTYAKSIPSEKGNCNCWKGYEPEEQQDGTLACVGVYLLHIMDCNVVQPPRCHCTKATGIITDKDGTACALFKRGREIRRWPCENRKEWETFLAENPDWWLKLKLCNLWYVLGVILTVNLSC